MRLTPDQIQAAEYEGSGAYAIKGVAGSGKTSIGLHRISYLLENKCPKEDDKVLMLTFNRALIKYLEYQYEKLAGSFPRQLKIDDASKRDPKGNVEINTVSEKSYICFEKLFPNEELRPKVLWRGPEYAELRKELFTDALVLTRQMYPDENILDESNIYFLQEEIQWMKASMFLYEKDYLKADRVMIGRDENELKRLPKNSNARKAIFSLHETYRRLLKENNLCEFVDTEIAAINYARKNNIERYTHIIVDESQDMSRLQLEFIKTLSNKRSYCTITFLYDITQSIYPNSWLGMGRSFASAGFDISGKTKILRKNYRTSNEILSTARNMINSEELVADSEPFYCNQTGIRPLLVHCADKEVQNMEIVKLISTLRKRFGLSDIAITSRYNKNLQDIREMLIESEIQAEIINRTTDNYGIESVKLITFHSFKGIESKVVIVVGLNADEFPYMPGSMRITKRKSLEERRLFYVAMTRASNMLFLFTYGTPSPFLDDIAPELVKRIKTVGTEDYFVEEMETTYGTSNDFLHLIKDIEADNYKLTQQSSRIEKVDRKTHPESRLLSRIVEFIKENNLLDDNNIDSPPDNILDGLLDEFKRKKEENQILQNKVNSLLSDNKELMLKKKQVPNYNSLKSDFKTKFPGFDDGMIEILISAEFFIRTIPNRNTDFSAQYIAYGKVLELLLKRALVVHGIRIEPEAKTLGKVFNRLISEEPEWRSALRPLEAIGFISKRNDATHTKKIGYGEISELRRILFDNNLLFHIGEMVA